MQPAKTSPSAAVRFRIASSRCCSWNYATRTAMNDSQRHAEGVENRTKCPVKPLSHSTPTNQKK
ncbi:hypothetical protein SAMN05444167_1534 [Terriglobus roseus]|uniref:Uncharacterized protein n=1 Tax=Terriglobus roseus TaxID=392734 RepID=A0A1G7IQ36_9BACT|nr:hypothetical protein SAMN05444167_1534 [Terriglobus roseus]